MTQYREYTIKPASAGFGEYDTVACDAQEDLDVLLNEIRHNLGQIAELGVDDLPEGIEDIRGSIHNEPTHVYVALSLPGEGEAPTYFGIEEEEQQS